VILGKSKLISKNWVALILILL